MLKSWKDIVLNNRIDIKTKFLEAVSCVSGHGIEFFPFAVFNEVYNRQTLLL